MSAPSEGPADVLLIGLGNLLLGDEGVGVHVLRRLEADYAFSPAVDLVDGGTTGLDLLPLFNDYPRILLIDAIVSAQPPGSLRILRNQEIQAVLGEKMSLHHLGISDVLAMSDLLGYAPAEIIMVGVVPEAMELDLELSPSVMDAMPGVIDGVRAILRDWGIESRPLRAF